MANRMHWETLNIWIFIEMGQNTSYNECTSKLLIQLKLEYCVVHVKTCIELQWTRTTMRIKWNLQVLEVFGSKWWYEQRKIRGKMNIFWKKTHTSSELHQVHRHCLISMGILSHKRMITKCLYSVHIYTLWCVLQHLCI